jgi:hypothetical protein
VKVWTIVVTDVDEPSVHVGKTEQEARDKLRSAWGVEDSVPDEGLFQAVADEYHATVYGPDEHDLDPKPTALEIWKQSPKCSDSMCACNRMEG